MCTNTRWITNKYDGRDYYVSCGHCSACIQEKADRRVRRIQNESVDHKAFFVTFSYTNDNIPYIKESEYRSFYNDRYHKSLDVYRGNDVIDTYTLDDFYSGARCTLVNGRFPLLKSLRVKHYNGNYSFLRDKVSVLYKRDFQLFFKRLKIYLVRHGYKGYFSYFYTGDYGGRYQRAHCHALIYFENGFDTFIRRAIVASWPYSDMSRPLGNSGRQPIELAKSAAKYVASYVNSSDNIPSVLSEARPFKFFHHFSNHFGCNLSEFSLASLISKVRQGDLYYDREVVKDGCTTISKTRVPDYVLSIYWPKFKGYSYLSFDEIVDLVERPESVYFLRKPLEFEDRETIFRQLTSLKRRIPSSMYFDWLNIYPYVWSLFSSSSIKSSYDDVKTVSDVFQHFNNILDYYTGSVRNDFLDGLMSNPDVVHLANPLDFPRNILRNEDLLLRYTNFVKHHSIKDCFYG